MSLLRYNKFINFTSQEIDSLISKGVQTVQIFLSCEPYSLSICTAISLERIKENQERLFANYSSTPKLASDFFEEQSQKRFFYSTGCPNLDEILEGGILSGEITELKGASTVGKTQFVHHMALELALEQQHVLIIDTDCSFSVSRLFQMFHNRARSEQINEVLNKIHVYPVMRIQQLLCFLEQFSEEINKSESFYSLVKIMFIDSLVTPLIENFYENDSYGRKQLSAIFSSFLLLLRHLLSKKPDMAIICTSGIINDFGMLWRNSCGLTLELAAEEDGTRLINVMRSTRVVKKGTAYLLISEEGFTGHTKDLKL